MRRSSARSPSMLVSMSRVRGIYLVTREYPHQNPMRPHDIVFMIYSVMIDGRKRSMLEIRVTMLHILRLLLGRKGCHDGSCMYGRSVPVRRSRGRERVDEYWDGTVRARRLHTRTVSPIQLRPTRSISCRTSNGMSPSSTSIIQITPSNPPRPSLPESQNSEKFS